MYFLFDHASLMDWDWGYGRALQWIYSVLVIELGYFLSIHSDFLDMHMVWAQVLYIGKEPLKNNSTFSYSKKIQRNGERSKTML